MKKKIVIAFFSRITSCFLSVTRKLLVSLSTQYLILRKITKKKRIGMYFFFIEFSIALLRNDCYTYVEVIT